MLALSQPFFRIFETFLVQRIQIQRCRPDRTGKLRALILGAASTRQGGMKGPVPTICNFLNSRLNNPCPEVLYCKLSGPTHFLQGLASKIGLADLSMQCHVIKTHMKKAGIGGFCRNSRLPQGCAWLGFFLLLILQLFAGSAALHQAIHPDAQLPDHHCAVTLFAQGQVSSVHVWTGLADIIAPHICSLPTSNLELFAALDCRLAPSRAPPLS